MIVLNGKEIVAGTLGVVAGLTMAGIVARHGLRWGLLDHPNPRSSHRVAIPKGGGIGILFAFCVVAAWNGFPSSLWLAAMGISLFSLLGDRKELSLPSRLLAQLTASIWVCAWLVMRSNALADWNLPGIAGAILVGAVFIAGTANVFNFMDGINGISALTGIVAFGMLAFTGGSRNLDEAWLAVAVALAAACAGFLPWNFPRAWVFMGDVGSILLGFVFATFAVAWSRSAADFVMFSLFLFPFFADELLTIIVRLHARESLLVAHRRHLYQILANQAGYAHWKVSLVYGMIQVAVAFMAVSVRPFGLIGEGGLALFLFFAAWPIGRQIRRFEFHRRGISSET